MNLANLENAREQLKLADNGVSVHIQDAIDSVDSAIRELEALPVVPTVEVGQVWVSVGDADLTLEILGVGNRVALWRNHWGDEATICLSTITKHYTLQTPAPEKVALRADDVSNEVVEDIRRYLHDDVTYTDYDTLKTERDVAKQVGDVLKIRLDKVVAERDALREMAHNLLYVIDAVDALTAAYFDDIKAARTALGGE